MRARNEENSNGQRNTMLNGHAFVDHHFECIVGNIEPIKIVANAPIDETRSINWRQIDRSKFTFRKKEIDQNGAHRPTRRQLSGPTATRSNKKTKKQKNITK